MVKIIARFIGRNSLGYIHGNTYDISILMGEGDSITIYPNNRSSGACVYVRMGTFLQNWKVVSYQQGYKVGTDVKIASIEGQITSIIRESKLNQVIS